MIARHMALGLLVATTASGGTDFGDLMKQLGQRQHARASFVERQYTSLLDEPLVSSGELHFDAPDHLEKITFLPRPETLSVEHGVATFERGKRRIVVSLSEYPAVSPLIDSLRATLAGDRRSLESNFQVQFEADGNHWSMQLVPRDPAIARLVRRVEVEGAGDAIGRLSLEQRNGDRSVMEITQEPNP